MTPPLQTNKHPCVTKISELLLIYKQSHRVLQEERFWIAVTVTQYKLLSAVKVLPCPTRHVFYFVCLQCRLKQKEHL